MSETTEGLWDFAVRTYRSPGIAEACLEMQNDHGADVNMLLFACWAGTRTLGFDAELFGRAMAFSDLWAEQVVRPLRGVRSWMKESGCALDAVDTGACMSLREDIKRVELQAEKLQLETLESVLSGQASTPLDQLLGNVDRYLNAYAAHAGIVLDGKALDLCARIVSAAYPEASRDDVDEL